MNRIISKLLVLAVLGSIGLLPVTNARYVDGEKSTGNTFAAGCWAPPSVPDPVLPEDQAVTSDTEVVFDWTDSSFVCPGETVTYQVEVYGDEALTQLRYQSGWLTVSEGIVPTASEGEYFWRVRARGSQDDTSAHSAPYKLTVDRSIPLTFSQLSSSGLMSVPEPQPKLTIDYRSHVVHIGISQTLGYDLLTYQLTYDTDDGLQGIEGRLEFENQSSVDVDDLLLGTCSKKSCLYHTGMKNIHVEATISGVTTTTLTGNLPL